MSPAAPPDPYLSLPLDGVRAIEASAGTGKTFTLATLVVRLVVERGLRIGQVLAVTFTEAATQELRSRIRARLVLAGGLVEQTLEDDAAPDVALTHQVVTAHLAAGTETADALRRRLHAAAHDIDLAAIFTIHGFCARVLREHALEAGQGFDTPELMGSDTTLRHAVAADLWRTHGVADDAADDLLAMWKAGPRTLAGDLSPLLRERVLRPTLDELPSDPALRLRAASAALADAFRAHGDTFRSSLVEAVEGKVLNGASYKLEWITPLFDALKHWCDGCDAGDPGAPFEHPKLAQLHRDTLLQRTNKTGAGRTPDSPVCDALPAYLDALGEVAEWPDVRRVELLHRLRDDARLRFARFKQQQRVQTYDDLIDRVADALEGEHAAALVARLREQYAVALVDEFQDTDPRQWRIFERVFGQASGAPALFVIGDPKQAIYGFRGGDVETYLQARQAAEQAPALSSNFRSRPSVLRAISALYAQALEAYQQGRAAAPPFVDPRIQFAAIRPGGLRRDDDHLRQGRPAPALTLWQAPPPPPDAKGKVKPYPAGRSRELATDACVAAIHRVLHEGRNGEATIEGRPVRPGDIAVLVRSHGEATRIRQALAVAGIPAVAAGKQTLFATAEARELHVLLLALLHGGDSGRLRTALATVLVGQDAAQLAALGDVAHEGEGDSEALHAWQLVALGWRDRLQRGGPLALVNDLCADNAGRQLGLLDGERRLTNYLQLAELLQEEQSRALGLHGLVDWLARSIAAAASDDGGADESRLLRLESDAHRVQVVTLHKSKGLEYPLVFLPYAGIGGKPRDAGRHVTVAGDGGRALHWKLLPSATGWDEVKQRWSDAQQAEDARLLYVGLTRARHALWLAGGAFYQHGKAAVAAMIADTDALAATGEGAIHIDHDTPPGTLPWLPPASADPVPPARVASNTPASDWWVYSFTQLANAEGQGEVSSAMTQPVAGGRDEAANPAEAADVEGIDAPGDDFDPRFAGARFGVVLHDVLERVDFAAWKQWRPGGAASAGDIDTIIERLRAAGYPAGDLDDGVQALAPLVGQTLTVALPEGVRLADLPEDSRRAEIEFQFALAPTRVDALIELLHGHGLLAARTGFGTRRRLEGLMTGLIDLTYTHDGCWYVLDYKSNRLPGYGPAHLVAAMAHSEYELQALIYTLALHRWLRFRLGEGYDYARDFGGVRYLFCRGLDATSDDGRGVHAWRFDPDLVHALDALFAGRAVEAIA
ncbi:exodeoxyribonuclease V subunit beta [Lysobacter sp. A3-1-A15]|uniref:exodeoxyribonuclease V subunit beta n=1 Tax=Novilysobacter viscosus TaxID=3098602 RepID=UPI002EDBA0D6